jgi:hypothetical protein
MTSASAVSVAPSYVLPRVPWGLGAAKCGTPQCTQHRAMLLTRSGPSSSAGSNSVPLMYPLRSSASSS